MKIHPLTPIVAMICITTYGTSLAVLGMNSIVTVLVVGTLSGLGGYGVKDLKEWLKKTNSLENKSSN